MAVWPEDLSLHLAHLFLKPTKLRSGSSHRSDRSRIRGEVASHKWASTSLVRSRIGYHRLRDARHRPRSTCDDSNSVEYRSNAPEAGAVVGIRVRGRPLRHPPDVARGVANLALSIAVGHVIGKTMIDPYTSAAYLAFANAVTAA